jgi:predicted transcriptional regulator
MMTRTQVQLPDECYRTLQREAARQNRSIADCIREGIALFLQRADASADELMAVAGKFQPLSTENLKPHDQWWADAAVAEQPKRVEP